MSRMRQLLCAAICYSAVAALLAQAPAQVIQGQALEDFLKTAPVTASKDLGQGVTISKRVTLEQGGQKEDAVFKIIDEKPLVGATRLADGTIDAEFQDSWKTEIAAYELDKMIGLGMVPATVERRHLGKSGSFQLWVTSMMNEQARQRGNVKPADPGAWNDQMHKLFVFDNLIYNVDRNLGNILMTTDWRMFAIDHSRAFRPYGKLKDPKLMVRFSRSLMTGLASLNEPMLKSRLGAYLTSFQIQGLLKRRDLIADYAKKLAADKGDAAVYYQ